MRAHKLRTVSGQVKIPPLVQGYVGHLVKVQGLTDPYSTLLLAIALAITI